MNGNKEILVNFRVTEEHYHLIRQKAAADGLKVSAWVRNRVVPDLRREQLETRMDGLEVRLARLEARALEGKQ